MFASPNGTTKPVPLRVDDIPMGKANVWRIHYWSAAVFLSETIPQVLASSDLSNAACRLP
jgi:hypothetical protein